MKYIIENHFLFRKFFPFHVLSLSPSNIFENCFQGLEQLEICVNDLPSNVKVDWKVWGLVDSTCGENYHVLSISFKEIMTQYFVKQNIFFSSIWYKELKERLLYESKSFQSITYLHLSELFFCGKESVKKSGCSYNLCHLAHLLLKCISLEFFSISSWNWLHSSFDVTCSLTM